MSTIAASPAVTSTQAEERQERSTTRLLSVDVFRGMVMTLMLAEVMHLPAVAQAFPGNAFWAFIAFHTSHVAWQGCSLHDLIQPGFSLLVGVSLPFSIASRRARSQSFPQMLGHAVWRAIVLIALGILLRSIGRAQTNFTFEDTLTQIGLGYVFLFLLGFVPIRTQIVTLIVILTAYWAAFAFHPGQWTKNANFASDFDQWFLNLFPREQPFIANRGGYTTLSFIPTLGTMILGLLAGGWLKSTQTAKRKAGGLLIAGSALVLAGLLLQWTGICPIVKRIWTPAFTLYSGGLVLLILSGLFAILDWKQKRRWAFPLVVVGMNSIAIYLMSWTMENFLVDALNRHLGKEFFTLFGTPYEAIFRGALVMLIFWSILYWMHRRKIYLRI